MLRQHTWGSESLFSPAFPGSIWVMLGAFGGKKENMNYKDYFTVRTTAPTICCNFWFITFNLFSVMIKIISTFFLLSCLFCCLLVQASTEERYLERTARLWITRTKLMLLYFVIYHNSVGSQTTVIIIIIIKRWMVGYRPRKAHHSPHSFPLSPHKCCQSYFCAVNKTARDI